MIWLRLIAP